MQAQRALQYVSSKISGLLEHVFARIGWVVGLWPLTTIFITIIIGVVCCFGLFLFREDHSTDGWLPDNALSALHKVWIQETFQDEYQMETMFLTLSKYRTTADGSVETVLIPKEECGANHTILTAEYLHKVLKIHKELLNLTVSHNGRQYNFTDLCYRKTDGSCYFYNLLSMPLVGLDDSKYDSLSDKQLHTLAGLIKETYPVQFDQFLGGVCWREDGSLEGALSTSMEYRLRGGNYSHLAQLWEAELVKWALRQRNDGIKPSVFTPDTLEEETKKGFDGDIVLLAGGYVLTFIYFAMFLGKFNRKEHKVWIAILGIVCIGFTLLMAAGLASALQMEYGPIHATIPFLLLGIGVDDMFVIVSSWQSCPPPKSHGKKSIVGALSAKALKAVGVSITVTSLTNAVSFFIGSATALPTLSSYCVYAGLSILCLFFFQITFFSAFVVIDYKRQQADLDAGIPFLKLNSNSSSDSEKEPRCRCLSKMPKGKWKEEGWTQWVLSKYLAPALSGVGILSKPFQGAIIIASGLLLGASIFACTQLTVQLDYTWLFPPDSYALSFMQVRDKYFPDAGLPVEAYTGAVNYTAQQPQLHLLKAVMDENAYVADTSIDFWYTRYLDYYSTHGDGQYLKKVDIRASSLPGNLTSEEICAEVEVPPVIEWDLNTCTHLLRLNVTSLEVITSEAEFFRHLPSFLVAPSLIGDFSKAVKFCSSGAQYCIQGSKVPAYYVPLEGTETELKAMDTLRRDVASVPFHPEQAFAYGQQFSGWETNYIIVGELTRNLIVAIGCIFVITLFLVADLVASVLVLFVVCLTMMDIIGLLYFWGLSINFLTATLLVLVVGMAVDYAAHVAHAFMRASGTRQNRVSSAVSAVGVPVLNGGFSTFLAFVLVAFSSSYAFQAFFKVFFGVVIFGLFHGLLLLPVLLALIGPPSHHGDKDDNSHVSSWDGKKEMDKMDVFDGKGDELPTTLRDIDLCSKEDNNSDNTIFHTVNETSIQNQSMTSCDISEHTNSLSGMSTGANDSALRNSSVSCSMTLELTLPSGDHDNQRSGSSSPV
jgi:predicted RND superfamily exporter protein